MDIKKFKLKKNTNRRMDLLNILIILCCYTTSPIISILMYAISSKKNNKLVAFHSFQSAIIYTILHTIRTLVLYMNGIGFGLIISAIISLIMALLTVCEIFFTAYGIISLYKEEVFGFKIFSNIFEKVYKA